jgi:hypothetical protein
MLRYKVVSGDYEVQVSEISFLAAAHLAIKLFDFKSEVTLGPIIMVTAIHDGEWCVVDTEQTLNAVGIKYKRVPTLMEKEDGEDSDT